MQRMESEINPQRIISFPAGGLYDDIKEAAWRQRLNVSEWLRRAAVERMRKEGMDITYQVNGVQVIPEPGERG